MTVSDSDISKFCNKTFNDYNDRWGNNYLLSRRSDDGNIKKVLLTNRVLNKFFTKLKNVYVCHTSDSPGLLYSLKIMYDCNITVLTNHPLFERLHEYYEDTLFGINYQKVDCIFDNPFKYTTDADLVIFPDTEYYVPFNMKPRPISNHPVCSVYYVDDINSITQNNMLNTSEEVNSFFSFRKTYHFAATTPDTGRHCYCGLGML